MGGPSKPFTHLNLAPDDTDFYAESELDLPELYKTLKEVVTKISGEPASNQLEATLKKTGQEAALSVLDLIYGLKGRSAVVLTLDPQQNMELPSGAGVTVRIPAFEMLLCIDGVGPMLQPSLDKVPNLHKSTTPTRRIYTLPPIGPGLQLSCIFEGSTFYLATSRAFFEKCIAGKPGLAQNAEFRAALARVDAEGNGLTYIHPRFFTRLRQIEAMNPDMPDSLRSTLNLVMSDLQVPTRPLVSVRTNLADGILIRSSWDHSLKKEIALVSVYNPVTIGLLAAMAVPAFQKVRTASQQKAVLNNLRQFAAAGDQYCLEHGVTRAGYPDLVGPDKYIRELNSVAGEDYRSLIYQQGRSLRVRLPDGRVVEYGP